MAEDAKWEFAILATVQGFYADLLQEHIGGELPAPCGLGASALEQGGSEVREALESMRRWLRLLDLAINPAMLRRAFTPDTDPEIAEALLRYFTRVRDQSDRLRDKTDVAVTFLYRNPRVPGQWERQGPGLDGSLPLAPFEIALLEILAESDPPSLPEEHAQLLRRLDPLLEQARQFGDLNALIESGIIAEVRQLKQALESSFYHPGVLATLAAYNVEFGKKFNQLFLAAAASIHSFADELERQGGNILGSVEGVDVTVEHVAELQPATLLALDYEAARDKFRRVSQLIKLLERRPPLRRKESKENKESSRRGSSSAKTAAGKSAPPPSASGAKPAVEAVASPLHISPRQRAAEETKLLQVEESIRLFVRVADPKFRQIVPMRFFNLTLTPAEASAYAADYLEEKSLRAAVARAVMRMAATRARVTLELDELKRNGGSRSLWKMHADALLTLLEIERTLEQEVGRLKALVKQAGASSPIVLEVLEACTAAMRAGCTLARNSLRSEAQQKAASAG